MRIGLLFKSIRIVGREPGPHLLITGGVHGDEFEPMAAARRLSRFISAERLCGTVTLVPVVNESAFECCRRTGVDELDLARTCPGRADGSITEQVASELSALIRQADYYIDLHTGGTRLRVLPLTGYTMHRDPAILAAQRRMARVFGLPIVWGTDPDLNGRSLSVARDAGVPAIYAEYQGGGGCDPQGIDAYVTGCLNVLADLSMLPDCAHSAAQGADGTLRRNASQMVVEDSRPGAGHMQVNHPAPMTGFFEPCVTLGQPVAAGELLGTISDVLGESVENIYAAYDGIVLVLHTFSRVEKGTSVAVILDTAYTVTFA